MYTESLADMPPPQFEFWQFQFSWIWYLIFGLVVDIHTFPPHRWLSYTTFNGCFLVQILQFPLQMKRKNIPFQGILWPDLTSIKSNLQPAAAHH